MISACAAFISYLIGKARQAGVLHAAVPEAGTDTNGALR